MRLYIGRESKNDPIRAFVLYQYISILAEQKKTRRTHGRIGKLSESESEYNEKWVYFKSLCTRSYKLNTSLHHKWCRIGNNCQYHQLYAIYAIYNIVINSFIILLNIIIICSLISEYIREA